MQKFATSHKWTILINLKSSPKKDKKLLLLFHTNFTFLPIKVLTCCLWYQINECEFCWTWSLFCSSGVLMVDRTDSGVWLLHSTPQFPYRRNRDNFWPGSGQKNAQIFICVTFPYTEFQKIGNARHETIDWGCSQTVPCHRFSGNHLQYIRAFPFEHDIPEEFHEALKRAANWDKLNGDNTFQRLQSKSNMAFHSIAKQLPEQPDKGQIC